MPVESSWYIRERVLLRVYSGDVTLDNIYTANVAARAEHIRASNLVPIHSIIDCRDATSFPRLDKIYNRVPLTAHPNSGWQVVIGALSIPVEIVLALFRMGGARVQHVTTVGDAVCFLADHDPTLEIVE